MVVHVLVNPVCEEKQEGSQTLTASQGLMAASCQLVNSEIAEKPVGLVRKTGGFQWEREGKREGNGG